jgi:hypothetical protein
MRKTVSETGKFLAIAGFAVLLLLFPALTPAWAQNTIEIDNVVINVEGDTGLDVKNNTVKITTGGYVNGSSNVHIYGGHVPGPVTGTYTYANINTIIIDGTGRTGSATTGIYGGYSEGHGEVNWNKVSINTTGTVHASTAIAGGFDGTGVNTVSDNSITIDNGLIYAPHISGGRGVGGVYATLTDNITNNTVTINGGTITINNGSGTLGIFGGERSAGANSGSVNDNHVYIFGGTVTSTAPSTATITISGGYSSNNNGTVTGNTVSITGAADIGSTRAIDIYGGYSYAGSGSATSNSVDIGGGTVTGNIYGGRSTNGTATGNSVTIGGGTVTGSIYGGWSPNGTGTNNTVSLIGGTLKNGNIYGSWNNTGTTTGSSVTIGGSLSGSNINIYGGWNQTDTAKTNSVTINSILTGSNINIYGGGSNTGNVTKNTVTIDTGGNVTGTNISGGYSDGSASVAENKVSIEGGTVTNSNIYGGYGTNGNATNNEVALSGGTVTGDIYGGWSTNGTATATGNTVTIGGGTVTGSIYGGGSNNGAATGNTVSLISGNVTATNISGGYSDSGSVTGNEVEITGGAVTGDIYGGRSTNGTATGNSVTIGGGTVTGSIYGGWSTNGTDTDSNKVVLSGGSLNNGSIYGSWNNTGTTTSSSVTIDGSVTTAGTTNIYGGWNQTGTATGNSVTINDSLTGSPSNISGGGSNSGTVTGNTISLISGILQNINISGGYSDGIGSVTKNTVSITNDTTVNTLGNVNIYGGYSKGGGNVTENTVSITDGTLNGTGTGSIYGGWSDGGQVTKNTVTLRGTPTLDRYSLYGYGGKVSSADGNLLELMESGGITVENVKDFESYRFCLSPFLLDDVVPLTVTGEVDFLSDSKVIEVHIMTTGDIAKPAGKRINLIDASKSTSGFNSTTIGNINNDMNVLQGTTLYYTGKLTQESEFLYLDNFSDPQVAPHAKAISEGSLTSTALVSQLSDLVAGAGLSQAVEAASEDEAVSEECVDKDICLKSFTSLTAGRMSYKTDSVADMDSLSLLSGLAWGTDVTPGRLTLGAFLEYGVGTYTTDSTYPDVRNGYRPLDIKGDGRAWHLGGGILGRLNFTGSGKRGSHAYVEGSLRAGQVNNSYGHPLEVSGRPVWVEFDTSAPYYGAHFGLGYLWNLSDTTSLDVYGKYLWVREEGDSVTLPMGDPIEFEAADSQRLQGGFRLTQAVNDKALPYIGAAYDYEFDSKARATTHGLPIDEHSISGGTWMGELGVKFKPNAALPVVLDLGLQGYTGIREGITGSLQLRVEF